MILHDERRSKRETLPATRLCLGNISPLVACSSHQVTVTQYSAISFAQCLQDTPELHIGSSIFIFFKHNFLFIIYLNILRQVQQLRSSQIKPFYTYKHVLTNNVRIIVLSPIAPNQTYQNLLTRYQPKYKHAKHCCVSKCSLSPCSLYVVAICCVTEQQCVAQLCNTIIVFISFCLPSVWLLLTMHRLFIYFLHYQVPLYMLPFLHHKQSLINCCITVFHQTRLTCTGFSFNMILLYAAEF